MKKSLKQTTLSSAIALTLGLTAGFSAQASSVEFTGEAACFDSGTAYDDKAFKNGDFVEVSGFFDANGHLVAYDVEHKKSSEEEIEFKGHVTYLMGDVFTLNGITVDASRAEFKDFSNGVFDGAYVEVEGYFDGDKMMATKVSSEDFEYGDKNKFEIKGYVSDFSDGYFKVNGITLDASRLDMPSAETQAPNNAYVEVEGRFVDGVLVINKCKVKKEEAEVSAMVSYIDMDNNSFEVTPVSGQDPIKVYTGTKTKFESEFRYDDKFQMRDLRVGDFVEVEGYLNTDGSLFADEVEVSDDYNVKVEGTVEAFKEYKITVLGVDFFIDSYTRFKGDDDNLSYSEFEYKINEGYTVVKVKDKDRDGVADKIELED